MNSLISGSDLKDTDNFASRVHRMLQLEYFEEHAKFPIEEDERKDEKSGKREEGEGMDVRAKEVSHMIKDTVERKGICVDQQMVRRSKLSLNLELKRIVRTNGQIKTFSRVGPRSGPCREVSLR